MVFDGLGFRRSVHRATSLAAGTTGHRFGINWQVVANWQSSGRRGLAKGLRDVASLLLFGWSSGCPPAACNAAAHRR